MVSKNVSEGLEVSGEGKGGVGADSRLGPEHLLGLNRVEFWQNSGLWSWGVLFSMFSVYSSSGDVSSEIYKVVAQGGKMWLEISVLM